MDFANMDRRQLTIASAGFSVMLTLHLTFQLLSQHLFYWKNPKEQKAILIIILMTPVYAIDSFIGLLDIRGSKPFFLLLDSVKECYEALVCALSPIFSFLFFIWWLTIIMWNCVGLRLRRCFCCCGSGYCEVFGFDV